VATTQTSIFTPEQEELRSSSRRFFEERFTPERVRELMETREGFDPDTWQRMCDLGWSGIAISEQDGGLGFGFVELGVLLEEMGRRLVASPFLSSVVLGANAIALAGTPGQRQALLPSIADGTSRATLAFTGPSGRWGADGIDVRTSDGSRLDGMASFVLDGASATLLVVAARTPDGVGLFLVDPDTAGVTRTAMHTLDATRKQAQIAFEGAEAERLGEGGDASDALQRTLDLGAIALACESVGGTQWCLDASSRFANERYQFGRPIGAFQAIKHRCADMLMHLETARSTAYYAAWAAAADDPELPQIANMAKAACSDTFFEAAADTIQIHGGIGFTWEHDAHLYLRRAKTNEIYLGDAEYHRAQLANRLGV